eukprot:1157630-Pelagomonas_calceolata.AAC.6
MGLKGWQLHVQSNASACPFFCHTINECAAKLSECPIVGDQLMSLRALVRAAFGQSAPAVEVKVVNSSKEKKGSA